MRIKSRIYSEEFMPIECAIFFNFCASELASRTHICCDFSPFFNAGLPAPVGRALPFGAPAPGRAPPRPDFFGAGFFSFFGARDIFRGRFLFFGNWRLPAMGLKPLFFRYRVIMVMLADCQRFLARADFPPLIGLRGAFAAARGGFWRPDLKCEKMRLLKINNLRRKLSDYYSLHARPRARGGGGGRLKIARSPIINILVRKKIFLLKNGLTKYAPK